MALGQPGVGSNLVGRHARRHPRFDLHRLRARPGRAAARYAAGGFGGAIGEWVVGARPQGVVAGDFNHDGLVDLAVAATGANALDVLYGAGTGGFTRRTFAAGRSLNVLSAVDLNADGWLEIAAASSSTNVVVIFRGASSGFTAAGTRPAGSIAARDRNRGLQSGRTARSRGRELRQCDRDLVTRSARRLRPARRLGRSAGGLGRPRRRDRRLQP